MYFFWAVCFIRCYITNLFRDLVKVRTEDKNADNTEKKCWYAKNTKNGLYKNVKMSK